MIAELHGLGGNLRTYWGRDDPSKGANWASVEGLKLGQAFALDKACTNAKYLKLPGAGDKSFLEGFTAERSKPWSEKNVQDVFDTWWPGYKLPKEVGLIDQNSASKLFTDPKSSSYKAAKAAIKNFKQIDQQNFGHVENVPSKRIKGRDYRGFTPADRDMIRRSFDENLKKAKKDWDEIYSPDRIILFIAQNPGSLALRQSVKTVLVNKYRKYTEQGGRGASDKEPKHGHVGEVVKYLYTFLSDQGVELA